jgi:hypothetical protein
MQLLARLEDFEETNAPAVPRAATAIATYGVEKRFQIIAGGAIKAENGEGVA